MVDSIIFRIIPGGCFLFYAGQLVNSLDSKLRGTHENWILGILYVLAIPFFASIVWWILVPSAFDPDHEQSHGAEKNLLGDLFIFLLNIGTLFYFSPPQSYIQYFSYTGILIYVGVFLADVFFMIRSAIKDIFAPKISGHFSRKSFVGLAVYFLLCLIVPAVFILYNFFVQLLKNGTSYVIFFSLLISFVIKVVLRYQKQVMPK